MILMRPTENDVRVLSRGLKEDILLNNERFERRCVEAGQ